MNLIGSTEKFLHHILGAELDFDLKNYLIKGSFFSVLLQFFSMGLNFIIGIILARLIGAEGYGTFTYIFTLLSVICTVAVFGMDDLLVREISSFQSKNDNAGIKGILRWALYRLVISCVIIIALLYFIIHFNDAFSLEKKSIYKMALTGIPVYAMMMLLQSGQRGLHQVVKSQFPEKIIRTLFFLIAVGLVYFFSADMISSYSMIAINIIAYGAALGLIAWQMRSKLIAGNTERINYPHLLKSRESLSSFYFFIATLMAVINVRADILMLGWMKSDTEVGLYNVAARFSDFTAFALLIVTPLIAPSISRLYSLNDKIKLQRLVSKAARANFLFAVIICLLLIFTGDFALNLFGEEFQAGYICMLLLCGGQLITTFAGPAGNILLMTGYEKLAFYSGIAGTAINIFLNLILIPDFGINGAALATACSLLVWNGLQSYFVIKRLKINTRVV